MSEVPRNRTPETASPTDAAVDRDLAALDARSRHDLKPLATTLANLSGARRRRTWEERLMTGFWTKRPRLAMAGAVAVLALALLVVPVSYERVTGHQVSVTLTGAQIERPVMDEIAEGLKTALGADEVGVAARRGDSGYEYTLSAGVEAAGNASPKTVAEAFARTLEEKGYHARAEVTPIRERTSGNVYAMMLDNVIRVSVDGKNADELEAEIAQQLAAAGVPNAEVSVTMDGDDRMEVQISAEAEGAPGEIDLEGPTRIMLTMDGEDLGGATQDVGVRVMNTAADDGTERMNVEVDHDGTTAVAVVDDPASLDDAALAAAISDQLVAQGLTGLSVNVSDGKVEVLVVDPEAGVLGAAEDGAQKKATWGEVKRKYGESN